MSLQRFFVLLFVCVDFLPCCLLLSLIFVKSLIFFLHFRFFPLNFSGCSTVYLICVFLIHVLFRLIFFCLELLLLRLLLLLRHHHHSFKFFSCLRARKPRKPACILTAASAATRCFLRTKNPRIPA